MWQVAAQHPAVPDQVGPPGAPDIATPVDGEATHLDPLQPQFDPVLAAVLAEPNALSPGPGDDASTGSAASTRTSVAGAGAGSNFYPGPATWRSPGPAARGALGPAELPPAV